MKKILEAIALALAGYIVYELVARYVSEKEIGSPQQDAEPSYAPEARPPARPAPANLGSIRGAAMTGGGRGAEGHTAGSDGSNLSERVGRGVIRRNSSQA